MRVVNGKAKRTEVWGIHRDGLLALWFGTRVVFPIGVLERNGNVGRVHCSGVIVEVMGLVSLGNRLGVFTNARMGVASASDVRERVTIKRLGDRWIHVRKPPE